MKAVTANAKYYVFEMQVRNRHEPLRQVNRQPLELSAAKDLARIGAKAGKHDRSVTTSPRSRKFEILSVYEAGTGENITQAFRQNRLTPHPIRRRSRHATVSEPEPSHEAVLPYEDEDGSPLVETD